MDAKKKLCLAAVMLTVNVSMIAGILYFTNGMMEKKHGQPVSPAMPAASLVPDGDAGEMKQENISGTDLSGLRSAEPSVSYKNVYSSLLAGEYVAGDGTAFKFDPGNSYSGYFNEEVPFAEHYFYEITNENDSENTLVIYSQGRQSEVRYSLDLDGEGNVVLAVPGTETKYVLCYDGTLYKDSRPEGAAEAGEKPAD